MAIAAPPRLLIADEPTTSLDLTIQAQYLGLLKDLQQQHRLAMIFVTHNLGIVAKICDRVAVMYAGRIVEIGPVRRIFRQPAHPYTRALIESIPRLGARPGRLTAIEGQPPDLADLPAGLLVRPALSRRDGALPRRGAARARPRRRPPGALLAARAGRVTPRHDRRAARAPRGGGPDQALSRAPGHAGLLHGHGARGRRDLVRHHRGPDARPRRRVGLRQDHDVEDDPRPRAADGRRHPLPGRGRAGARPRGAQALPEGGPGRLPGSVCLARSADARRHHRGRAARHQRAPERSGAPPPRARIARPGRPARARGRSLPPRVLGRPAPARGHRARARAVAAAHRPGRARLRPRRLDPRPGPEPPGAISRRASASPISSSPTTWPRSPT